MVTRADAAINKFEERFTKLFGAGTLVSDEAEVPYKVISTGSLELDYKLGVGGWVMGRLHELYGQDDIGKGLMMLGACREAQRSYPLLRVLWIDMEQKWDWPWARKNGVITTGDRFKLYVPESAEDVSDAIKEAIRSGLFSLIVLDSIGAMIPEVEKEKDADEAVMAKQAQIITRMVKVAAVEARKSETCVVFINQVRANLSGFGKATTTGGGFALKFCSTQKIEMKSTGTTPLKVKEDANDVQVGREVACFIERNKVAQAKRTAFITLIATETEKFGAVGIDRAAEAANMGIKTGVIAQSGGWYTMPTGQRINGKEQIVELLRSDPEELDDIRRRVLATVTDEVVVGPDAEPEIDENDPDIIQEAKETHERLNKDKLEGTGVFRKHGEKETVNG